MVIFVVTQLILLGVCFFAWWSDPIFLNIGYVIYHFYPVALVTVAFITKERVKNEMPIIKFLGIMIPFSLWILGVFYIYQSNAMM